MYIARLDDNIYMENATTCALAHMDSRALTTRRTLTTTGSPFVCSPSRWHDQRDPHPEIIPSL